MNDEPVSITVAALRSLLRRWDADYASSEPQYSGLLQARNDLEDMIDTATRKAAAPVCDAQEHDTEEEYLACPICNPPGDDDNDDGDDDDYPPPPDEGEIDEYLSSRIDNWGEIYA